MKLLPSPVTAQNNLRPQRPLTLSPTSPSLHLRSRFANHHTPLLAPHRAYRLLPRRTSRLLPCLASLALLLPGALQATPPPRGTSLTVYNQNFAVVRETLPLDLTAGVNTVTFDRATFHVEPDSVILRDPTGRVTLRVLEQSYRADTASQGLLLSLYEGREIDFLVIRNGQESTVRGRIIRAGYTPNTLAAQRYGHGFLNRQNALGHPIHGTGSTLIEVDGQLRFSLPGEPLFPALADDSILRPTLSWRLSSDLDARFDAELGYLTGGLSWQAAYNLVAPERGDTLDLVGWITLDNQSGRTFDQASIKLMAGDVNKIDPSAQDVRRRSAAGFMLAAAPHEPAVTEKTFDEYHLYSLALPVTLRDRETKQVEFIRATNIQARTVYVYRGADLDSAQTRNWNQESIRNNRDYGIQSNPKVWVYREIENTTANGLGLPLPKGRTRFYREDSADQRLEFTGENTIDHTPVGETLRVYTGDAFDLVGSRLRTDYQLARSNEQLEEAFEIRLRNRKTEPVEIRVAETLYRWFNWTLLENSDPYVKTDDRNIEFRVTLAPDEEKIITYRVRYDWK